MRKEIGRCLNLFSWRSRIVGNQGVRLSGGQKQRIGIARALYRNKKILILDEATSSLDSETEKKLLDDLFELKGEITLLAVTHRVNVLKSFDVIFKIKDNEVIELKDHWVKFNWIIKDEKNKNLYSYK